MSLLQETIRSIRPLDEIAMASVQKTLRDRMPRGKDFGLLENILVTYAGITGESAPAVPQKCTVVACADHGVAEMKISAYPPETTVQMTRSYLTLKGAVANALSNFSGAHMIVVDMGIAAETGDIPGLIDRKIAFGTNNCAKGPAMTRAQAVQALETGIAIANEYAAKGYRCFLPGEMGIANTTSSAAIVATLCGLSPEQATGRGTNISDERLKVKISVVCQALAVNAPDASDGIDVLAKVGGFELGCIAGIILGAAANRAFVVLDGFNTGAAALLASAICPLAKRYLMGSHLAAEPAHGQTLKALGIRHYMDMQFRLGEATGSSIAVNLLDATVRAYQALCAPDCGELRPPLPLPAEALSETALQQIAAQIEPLDTAATDACQLYIDNLIKPIHSLGALERLATKLAGITACEKPPFLEKTLLLFCADTASSNAQAGLGVAFAAHAEAKLLTVSLPAERIGARSAMLAAVAAGFAAARGAVEGGARVIGIGFSGAAACETPALLPQLEAQKAALLDAASPALAALAGAILGGAKYRAAIVLDDALTLAAAQLAVRIAPAAQPYLILTERPAGCGQILPELPAYLHLGAKLGGGCVSALGMKLVDASLHMLNDMKTFGQAAVAVADDGPGAKRQDQSVG